MGMLTPWMVIFIGSLLQILVLLLMGTLTWRGTPIAETPEFFRRWSQNISLEIVNKISLPVFLFPVVYFLDIKLGLRWLETGSGFRGGYFLLSLVIIDFVFYWRHRFYHLFFKPLHHTHHNDQGFDVSLTLRFHPVENFFNYIILFGAFYVLGLNALETAWMIQIFGLQAFISHIYSFQSAGKWQKILGGVMITPYLHRGHHRNDSKNGNFGFVFSIWDRLFKTLTVLALVIGMQMPIEASADQFAQAHVPTENGIDAASAQKMQEESGLAMPINSNRQNLHRPKEMALTVCLAAAGIALLLGALFLFYKAGKMAAAVHPGTKKYFILGTTCFIAGSVLLVSSAYIRGTNQRYEPYPGIEYNSPVT